jgi:CubicO group peptidase (beta-lactamase class C family)
MRPITVKTIIVVIFISGTFRLFAQVPQNTIISNISPEQHLVDELIAAINMGSQTEMVDFIIKHTEKNLFSKISPDFLSNFMLAYYYESAGRGYEVLPPASSASNAIKATLQNRFTGARLLLEIPVSNQETMLINGFVKIEMIEPKPNEISNQCISDKELAKEIEKCLNLMVKEDEFSGSVLLLKNGKALLRKAVGEASKSYQIPNRTSTRFNLASVGKIFTGLAITQLAEEGKLSFNDTISRYLPEGWLPNEISEKITIKHLLTHTSGLGDYFSDMYSQNNIQYFRELDEYKLLTLKSKLNFEPGTRFSYSNTGYLLLGAIIEAVSGETYFDFLKKRIFIPAGMHHTDGFDKDKPVVDRATGYSKTFENGNKLWLEVLNSKSMKGNPSGGIYSSIDDLALFDNALKKNLLLKNESMQTLFTGFSEVNASFHSPAFFLSNGIAGRSASHSGDGSGVNCQYKMYLDSGFTFIILSNYSAPSANTLAHVIEQLIAYKIIK